MKETKDPLAVLLGAVLVMASACAGARPAAGPGLTALRAACPPAQHWDGRACRERGRAAATLDASGAALEAFDVEKALPLLAEARTQGPLRHDDHVRLYEQEGIARAYLGEAEAASRAFEMLLALAPGHLLSYRLSPKVTFVFERAREEAAARATTAVDVSWPQERLVSDEVPVDVEVVSDPKGLLSRATLFVRRVGDTGWRALDLGLPEVTGTRRVVVPAVGGAAPSALEMYLVAYDAEGNEVLEWADPARPRRVALGYEAPVPWYRKWWVWAVVGGVVAAGTGATVYAVSQEPPDTVGGAFESR